MLNDERKIRNSKQKLPTNYTNYHEKFFIHVWAITRIYTDCFFRSSALPRFRSSLFLPDSPFWSLVIGHWDIILACAVMPNYQLLFLTLIKITFKRELKAIYRFF